MQVGSVDDTLTSDQLWKLALTMLKSKKPTAERDLSIAMWMCNTLGRGDDARLVFLPDLLAPELLRVIGECLLLCIHLAPVMHLAPDYAA